MECLKDVVGVTSYENECITAGISADDIAKMKLSTSGLYMDDLEGSIHLKAVRHADSTRSLFSLAIAARDGAIRQVQDDLTVALNNVKTKSRKNFQGQVGRASFNGTLAVSGRFQGVRLRPVNSIDALMILEKFMVILNAAATFKIYLHRVPYKSVQGEEIAQWEVTTEANTFLTVIPETPLKLPFRVNGETVEYWLFWDRTEAGGANPKNNKVNCTTCERRHGPATGDYMEVKGVSFESTSNLNSARTDDYSHGLVLSVQLKCDNETLFCGQYRQDDAIAVTLAHAVRFKAAEKLIQSVRKSPDINRYTTMDSDRLKGSAATFKKQYEERILWLANSIDLSASNCFVCAHSQNQPYYGGILA